MDIEETVNNPFFWIITSVGYGAFVIMLMMLKGMGNQSIMPMWVKIVTLLLMPVIGFVFTQIFDN